MIVCKRVNYTGRVQGVGFRYTALSMSWNYKVAGTVRNCPDGSVELEVQGDQRQVQEFLAALHAQMSGNITDHVTEDICTKEYQDFSIIP